MNIAICDDDQKCVDDVQKLASNYSASHGMHFVISQFTDTSSFLKSDVHSFDIIFLDVAMGKCNGIDIAKDLRKSGCNAVITFISSYVEFAPQGYVVSAFRYLLKQDLSRTFDICMNEVLDEISQKCKALNIKINSQVKSISLCDILYIEIKKRIANIHFSNKSSNIISYYDSISRLENELNSKGFLRIQRSFLVNISHIDSIKSHVVFLDNGEQLKTSKQNYHELLKAFALWKGKN